MPQILLIVAPKVQHLFNGEDGKRRLDKLGWDLILETEGVYGLHGEEDVSFTAISAMHTIREADFQVEVRYTAGTDEYERGEPFEPTKKQMEELAEALITSFVVKEFPIDSSLSVWIIAFKGTVFKHVILGHA